MGRSCRQGSHGPVDASSRRRCLAHLVLDQRLQPRELSCASRLHMRGSRLPRSPGRSTGMRPTSMRAVIVPRRLVVQVP